MTAQLPRVERLGVIMRPDPARADEVEGVLNPGAARGPDGNLYLFPRLVGEKNFSRIGIARVLFNDEGDPVGVERLGYALEPEESYELRPREGTGGCEDPRVTFVEPLRLYVMAYVAWGPHGPRIALAVSEDCLQWERLGLVDFQPDVAAEYRVNFNNYDNKDAAFAPDVLKLRDSTAVLVLAHRPFYDSTNAPKAIPESAPSIWVSACDFEWVQRDLRNLCVMRKHALLVEPNAEWEELRIGLGTPPLRTPQGYMSVYHGVSGELAHAPGEPNRVHYEAGVMVMSPQDNRLLEYRSRQPILIPEVADEISGAVNNVVFPTGIDKRAEGVYDVYYGMADKYIGIARLWTPDVVEQEAKDLPFYARLKRLDSTG